MCIVSVLVKNIRSDTGGNTHQANSDKSGLAMSLQHEMDGHHKIDPVGQMLRTLLNYNIVMH